LTVTGPGVRIPLSPPTSPKTTINRGFFIFKMSQACLSEYIENKKISGEATGFWTG
jgi:hypothetical protein